MAKSAKRQPSRRKTGALHTRVVCPQCGKRVNVPAQLGLGQQSYPCPSCRVPINRSLIEASLAANAELQPEKEDDA